METNKNEPSSIRDLYCNINRVENKLDAIFCALENIICVKYFEGKTGKSGMAGVMLILAEAIEELDVVRKKINNF